MYGDTDAIRLLARQLRSRADEVRREAELLCIAADTVLWVGAAASALRQVTRSRVAALRRTADLHEEAAHALDRHAATVEAIKRLIAEIERRVRVLIAAARERIAALAGVVGALIDPLDDLLDRFVPPPSGHRDWLDVHLPGVHLPSPACVQAIGAAA